MKRRSLVALGSVAAALAAATVAGCATRAGAGSGGIAVAGETRADLVSVAAPGLSTPALDVTVGIARPQQGAGIPDISASVSKAVSAKSQSAAAQQRAAAAAGARPVPAGLLATVTVVPGSIVHEGQVVAVFDTRLLDLGVANAQAAYRRQLAQADALSSQASELRDQRGSVREQRAKLIEAQAQLESTLAQAETGMSQLKGGVAQLSAQVAADGKALAAAEEQLAATPAGPAHDALASQVAGLKQKIAAEQARLAKLQAQLQQVEAGVPRLRQGLAQAQAGRGRIASGLSQLTDAIGQLESGSEIVRAYASAQAVAVELARAALSQGTLRAPCDGVVVGAMHSGEVAIVGAPVVAVRPAGPTLVDSYLTSAQLAGVRAGVPADVALDSVRGVLNGRVRDVGANEEFPPSNYPTQIVHLSRVVRVTVSVPETLPLGVPADVVIRPKSE